MSSNPVSPTLETPASEEASEQGDEEPVAGSEIESFKLRRYRPRLLDGTRGDGRVKTYRAPQEAPDERSDVTENAVATAPGSLLSPRGFILRRILLIADLCAIVLAAVFTDLIEQTGPSGLTGLEQIAIGAVFLPIFVVLGSGTGLYHLSERHMDHTLAEEIGPALTAVTAWTWLVMIASGALADGSLQVAWFAIFWLASAITLLAARLAVRSVARRQAWYRQRVVVIGDLNDVKHVVNRIERHPEWGIERVGCLLPAGDRLQLWRFQASGDVLEGPVSETVRSPLAAMDLIRQLRGDRVILASWSHSLEDRTELIRNLVTAGVHVDIVSGEPEALCAGASLHHIEGMPVMTVRPARIHRFGLAAKRGCDVLIAGTALLLLSPFLVYIAIRIKIDSPGPVLFRHKRMGREGHVFEVLKFRTMRVGAESQRAELREAAPGDSKLFKLREDPRVTKYGAILRRRSFDEIPQLWNVLVGDMSIVGPRPLPLDEAPLATAHFAERASLRPGITGPWQIHGRSDIPFEDMIKLDYSYVSSWSLEEDLRLLIRTVGVVFSGRGAY